MARSGSDPFPITLPERVNDWSERGRMPLQAGEKLERLRQRYLMQVNDPVGKRQFDTAHVLQ